MEIHRVGQLGFPTLDTSSCEYACCDGGCVGGSWGMLGHLTIVMDDRRFGITWGPSRTTKGGLQVPLDLMKGVC